jgi:hypothetical protein
MNRIKVSFYWYHIPSAQRNRLLFLAYCYHIKTYFRLKLYVLMGSVFYDVYRMLGDLFVRKLSKLDFNNIRL